MLKGIGFADGGYTGNGGKHEPAGIVHRGEYVFDKAATARLGAGNLEALRRGKSLPGFASGGAVGIPTTLKAPPSMAGAAGGGMAQTNNVTVAPVYNITTNGGDKDNAGLKDTLAQSNVDLERMVKALLVEDARKMGPVASAYQGRFGLNPARGIG
uniref:CAZy families GH23 protein n=1 Tax=uncultured Methylobacterium sp. TaxID=157278 RepID=A0A060C3V6_9HYPH|nr:CAZy families GH23 protein [uncultured Methylobacterium sp.]